MRGRLTLLALVATTSLAVASSCALEGFNRVEATSPPADAGTDAPDGDAPDADAATGCALATYPAPPSTATDGGAEDFVVAVRSIDLGENAGGAVGLDLDGKCTCDGDPPDPPTCKEPKPHCDGPEGRDNGAAPLMKSLGLVLPGYGSAALTQQAEQGKWSLLLRVRGYNGEPDDGQVELDWYITGSFATAGTDAGTMPAWDGQDRWPVSTDSLLALDGGTFDVESPKYADTGAYVSAGVLVAGLPDVSFTLSGNTSSIAVRLRAGYLVAHIETEPTTGARTLRDGLVVARWTLADFFAGLSSFRDDNNQPICTDNPFWNTGKGVVCGSADILSSFGAPTKPCDSISFGAAIQAFPAQLGDIFSPPAVPPGCPPATDPINATCP